MKPSYSGLEIAIIGMSGKFPGADDKDAFWLNLKNGVESIVPLSTEEMLAENESLDRINDPAYVNASAYIHNKDCFDSGFFSYSPNESILMDPQTRIFHECVWDAIEDAGYNVADADLKIGLFAGSSSNLNWEVYTHFLNEKGLVDHFTASQLRNARFLATKVSYTLNLRGPSIYIDSACSTSLVAVHQACKSLLLGECSMAVAGGITVNNYSKTGYLYEKGMISSPDGHCRVFDKDAAGTVSGEGAGVVVLKTLKNAIKDNDHIYAIIKGSGVNNDGNSKVGFTAPSVDGQLVSILTAHKWSKIEPESISYVEAHGTGTILGDPIEIEALNLAFGKSDVAYCGLGSVKSNIGHLDAAAGVAGLIKTVLSLKHRQLPPSLHYKAANPKINFDQSPFYVNTELKEWKHEGYPLRAGVSSFGIGGTNAHLILEEAPAEEPGSSGRGSFLLPVSAKSPTALLGNLTRLKTHLESHPDLSLADVAYTLQTGRCSFGYRKSVVCRNLSEAIAGLTEATVSGYSRLEEKWCPTLVFMFSGQGSQYVNMFRELYDQELVFRESVEHCFSIVQRLSGKDLGAVIFPDGEDTSCVGLLEQTEYTQPALFVIEYSLVQLLKQWGIQPDLMIGHSIGEYVAACLSGLFSLEDALSLVIKRGELMQKVSAGLMLSISISSGELVLLLKSRPGLSLAAINSTELCVVSGEGAIVLEFQQELESLGYRSKVLRTSHAFHSHMMDVILDEFADVAGSVSYGRLSLPFISNLTGKVVSDQEVGHGDYWVKHLRETVNFSMGIESVLLSKDCILLEVGPGKALSTLVMTNYMRNGDRHKVISLSGYGGSKQGFPDDLRTGMGKLWEFGLSVNWSGYYSGEKRRRVPLPGYSFDQRRYPVHVNSFKMISDLIGEKKVVKQAQISDWLYHPGWKLSLAKEEVAGGNQQTVLIFADQLGVCEALAGDYRNDGDEVILVYSGENYKQHDALHFELRSGSGDDYAQLMQRLTVLGLFPGRVIHGWGISSDSCEEEVSNDYFYSLAELCKSLQEHQGLSGKAVLLLTSGLHEVLDPLDGFSEKSLSPALLKVLSQEYPSLLTSHIDISLKDMGGSLLYTETRFAEQGKVISLRHGRRWEQHYDRISVLGNSVGVFKSGSVYLITGGLGAAGYQLGLELLEQLNCRVILVGRTILPEREQWGSVLSAVGTERRIKEKLIRLQELEQRGDVVYLSCEIENLSAFEKIVNEAEGEFGQINGVIHAAGIVGGSSVNAVSDLKRSDYEQQFAPKVSGLAVLAKVFGEKALDFCILTSSLSAVLGGVGFGAYGSANAFMDHYINEQRSQGRLKNWVSVNLDGIDLENEHSLSINRSELLGTLAAALQTGLPQVVVSTTALNERLDKWVYGMNDELTTKPLSVKPTSAMPEEENSSLNETQLALRKIWIKILGNDIIGLHDNFYDLGGHSLSAMRLSASIKSEFNMELSFEKFFELNTIDLMSQWIMENKNNI
ncbi:type I polyketide synthase [Pedobacter sp. MR22-3]|uniref:type I polyketide synthase n=1 Tax=Pedobacter sp. MR22-3 TaxID=2994552 RepID=UPI002247ECEC|nr:type I polyketide synthase [Pedobacter sp. MR22-3]MCX2584720.1 type I polyketide synthase [Pedobacter sp. MR22-3]